jgi:hypothetical protein
VLGGRKGLGVDWKKVERVRRSIERGEYTRPAFPISSAETDSSRFSDRLLRDINEPAKQAREISSVSETLWSISPGGMLHLPLMGAVYLSRILLLKDGTRTCSVLAQNGTLGSPPHVIRCPTHPFPRYPSGKHFLSRWSSRRFGRRLGAA